MPRRKKKQHSSTTKGGKRSSERLKGNSGDAHEPAFPQLARQISSGLKEQINTASQEDENKSESFGEEEKGDERVHGESDISSGEERIVMPDSLFYEQAGGVTGLVNLGNTCFLNSVLQTLTHLPPLIAYFSCPPDPRWAEESDNEKFVLCHNFTVLMRRMWDGRHDVIAPRGVLDTMRSINSFFRGYNQHDAQELVRSLVDNLDEGLKIRCKYDFNPSRILEDDLGESSSSSDEEVPSEENEDARLSRLARAEKRKKARNEARTRKRQKAHSFVSDTFQGTLESVIKCTSCGARSTTHEPFFDLSLELPKTTQLKKVAQERGEKATSGSQKPGWFGGIAQMFGYAPSLSLETCLHSFCTSESLVQDEQYRCGKCKEKVDAVKALAIVTLPEVLCIHIKRFSVSNYFGSKVSRQVTFPTSGLDLSHFVNHRHNPTQKVLVEDSSSSSDEFEGSEKDEGMHSDAKRNEAQERKKSRRELQRRMYHERIKRQTLDPEDCIYDLCGLIRHIGSASGGHYIAYALHHMTNKWYCFDDSTVFEVSEETVKKQEAYVLFYQRRPDFRKRKKAMELISRCIKDGQEYVQRSLQSTKQQVSSGRAETKDAWQHSLRYVSRAWITKMAYFSRPSPLDNRNLVCPHGFASYPIPLLGDERAAVVTTKGWVKLQQVFGGGPCISYLDGKAILDGDTGDGKPQNSCVECSESRAKEKLKYQKKLLKREKDYITHLEQEANRDVERRRRAGDSTPLYVIHNAWLSKWWTFVTEGGAAPGPISNHELLTEREQCPLADRRRRKRKGNDIDSGSECFDSDDDEWEEDGWCLREGLKPVQDYRGLRPLVWNALRKIYGGGPAIIRLKVDIYSERVGQPDGTLEQSQVLVPPTESTKIDGNEATNKRRKENR